MVSKKFGMRKFSQFGNICDLIKKFFKDEYIFNNALFMKNLTQS